jgi:hypothetical protein
MIASGLPYWHFDAFGSRAFAQVAGLKVLPT